MMKSIRAFLLCSLLSVPFLDFSPAHAAVFTNGPNVSSTCLDVKFANTANFTPIQSFPCNVTFAQVFNFVGPLNQEIFAIGGKCVDVNGAGTAAGTVVQLFDCNGTVAQQWQYIGGFLFNPNSGKCLDVGNGAAGTQARIEPCNGTNGQRWVIR